MPQSRHRKIAKARKRPKGLYPTSTPPSVRAKSRNIRIVAIALVAVLTLGAIAYVLIWHDEGRSGGGEDLTTTPSGLQYVDLVEGTGQTPINGQTVVVNYVGTLQDGTEFDSSYRSGRPFEFRIGTGSVIAGWDEGLMTMKAGGKRKLVIPPKLGYGASGSPPTIPPNSTLVFEIEMLGFK